MSDEKKAGWLAVVAGLLQIVLELFDKGRRRRRELERLKSEIRTAIDNGDTARLNLLLQRLRRY